jgi:hypothetical protein
LELVDGNHVGQVPLRSVVGRDGLVEDPEDVPFGRVDAGVGNHLLGGLADEPAGTIEGRTALFELFAGLARASVA